MLPKTPFHYQLWINGKEVPSESGKRFERKSPAHGTVVGDYAEAGIHGCRYARFMQRGKLLIADPGRILPGLIA